MQSPTTSRCLSPVYVRNVENASMVDSKPLDSNANDKMAPCQVDIEFSLSSHCAFWSGVEGEEGRGKGDDIHDAKVVCASGKTES